MSNVRFNAGIAALWFALAVGHAGMAGLMESRTGAGLAALNFGCGLMFLWLSTKYAERLSK